MAPDGGGGAARPGHAPPAMGHEAAAAGPRGRGAAGEGTFGRRAASGGRRPHRLVGGWKKGDAVLARVMAHRARASLLIAGGCGGARQMGSRPNF